MLPPSTLSYQLLSNNMFLNGWDSLNCDLLSIHEKPHSYIVGGHHNPEGIQHKATDDGIIDGWNIHHNEIGHDYEFIFYIPLNH